jgi:hypothetical protein
MSMGIARLYLGFYLLGGIILFSIGLWGAGIVFPIGVLCLYFDSLTDDEQ